MSSLEAPTGPIDDDTYLDAIRRASRRLVHAAQTSGLGADVSTCPGWDVEALIGHLGGVQRWATAIIAQRSEDSLSDRDESLFFNAPTGPAIIDWFVDGSDGLVAELEAAPADLTCFTFLPATSARAFWCRRQAHEASIHCADAEIAAGVRPEFASDLATDGINELVDGFFARPRRRPIAGEPFRIDLRASDTGASWHLDVNERGVERRSGVGADCVVSATVSDLYLAVWNRRRDGDSVVVTGETGLLDSWSERLAVRWG